MKLLVIFAIVAATALNVPSVSGNFVGGFGNKARLPSLLKSKVRDHGGDHCSYQNIKDKLNELETLFDCYQSSCIRSDEEVTVDTTTTTTSDDPTTTTPEVSFDTNTPFTESGSSAATFTESPTLITESATFTESALSTGDSSPPPTASETTTTEGPIIDRAHGKAREHADKLKSRAHGKSKNHGKAKHHEKAKSKAHGKAKHHSKSKAHEEKNKNKQ